MQVAVEGIPHFIPDYEKRLRHTKVKGKDGKMHLIHVREIKMYDLVFEECALEEVKAVLPAKQGVSGFKYQAFIKFAKLFGLAPVNPAECGSKWEEWNSTYGAGGDLHLNVIPLSTIKDRKREDGSDFL